MNEMTTRLRPLSEDVPEIGPASFVRDAGDGMQSLTLLVDGIHCAACVQRIEGALEPLPGIVSVRGNLTLKRLEVCWRAGETDAGVIISILEALGYSATPFAAGLVSGANDEGRKHLRALAVAGFAAANVMLLSVALWSGAVSDMDATTRGLFHWISALIVLPAAVYAVCPFAVPAFAQLRQGIIGMDLPITIAVVVTLALSLAETIRGGPHIYFEAAIMLLFFLLIGRTLDAQARAGARQQAENLLVLRGTTATVLDEEGHEYIVDVSSLRPGMCLMVSAGDRISADGMVETGQTDLDTSLVTGESVPVSAAPGASVLAGTVNVTAPIRVRITAAGEATVLAEIARLMTAATQARSRYVRIADRVARIYAPVVHLAALLAFGLWWGVIGVPWQEASVIAVAVLIITCPCALGLAVPVVQVVAGGRLLAHGIILKSADGLERLAEVDHVIFDKTGTLTEARLVLANANDINQDDLAFAATLAAASRHPLARALVSAAGAMAPAKGVREFPGAGLSLAMESGAARLGRRKWCLNSADVNASPVTQDSGAGPELWLSRPGRDPVVFHFSDTPRADAAVALARLRGLGLSIELLSGDRSEAVSALATGLGIDDWQSEVQPADKVARLEELSRAGRKVVMVGDGLNDAPALAAAHASMSPASAADISQAAADFIFQGKNLSPVPEAIMIARRARGLARSNFALAFAYNLFAVPIAMAGLVTPLIAAVAMSASSLIVTLNALRLKLVGREASS